MVAELYSRGEPKAPEPKVVEQRIPEPKVAEAKPAQAAKVAQGFVPASASSAPIRLDPVATAPLPAARVTTGSTEPIRPVPVKTFLVRPGANVQTASIAALYLPSAPPTAEVSNEAAAPAKAEMPSGVRPAAAPSTRVASASIIAPLPPSKPQQAHTGWIVQVGAYPAETEAKQRLSSVKSKAAKLLAGAEPFTEPVHKGDTTLYRARFAGLDKDRAEAACKFLKRNDVDCVTIKN
jgi:D-alanyl-D-alanine carboxypeptidase